MNAFLKFNKGMLRMPFHWQLWLLVLVTANVIGPLIFLDHVEARIVLGTILASMMLMVFLTARFGFTRILGLGHILWIPMLLFLFTRLGHIPATDAYGIWIRVLMVLNTVSLVIDAVDVGRYMTGDRQETVKGL